MSTAIRIAGGGRVITAAAMYDPDAVPLSRQTGRVLGIQIDALTWQEALSRLLAWGRERQSRYVAICNVHVVATASRYVGYRRLIEGADMATPDGAPARPGCCSRPVMRAIWPGSWPGRRRTGGDARHG